MNTRVVGSRVVREDAWGKVFGQTKFPADVNLPDQLYGVVVRSPHPHARVRKVFLEQAMGLPGVVTVLTAKDVPHNSHGVLFRDQPVLADYIRMVGDPVAVVGAETLEIARAAAKLVEVDYEVLSAVFDPQEAMTSEVLPLHLELRPTNVLYHLPIRHGSMDEGWAKADVVIEQDYSTPHIDHAFLQPEAVLAHVDERGHMVVQTATQYAHYDRGEIAHALGLRFSQVQVKTLAVGGAFGGREDISLQILAALMAWKTLRPVKMENTREESFYSHSKRHPMRLHYKTGATKDGKLVAMEARIIGDAGAYASWSINVLRKSAVHATGPYEIPNVSIDSYAVYTNNPYSGAMRGFGAAQTVLAYESQMDLLAKALGISPLEIRLRNIFKSGSTTATGQLLTGSVPLDQCLNKILPYLQSQEDKQGTPSYRSGNLESGSKKRRGTGLGCAWYGTGYGNGFPDVSSTFVEIHDDGSATVLTGAVDVGQGSNSIYAQITAEELGLQAEDICVYTGDTDSTPDSGTTAATRQTYNTGNAVLKAVRQAKVRLLDYAAHKFSCPTSEGIELEAGFIGVKGDPSRRMPLADMVFQARLNGERFISAESSTARSTPVDPETGQGAPYWPYSFGCQMAEVEVDMETGLVRVLKVVAVHDVGKALNPTQVEGQIAGGVAQGIGFALLEELELHEGKIKNPAFSSYLIPTALDVPNIEAFFVEDPECTGPFGAKGLGEPAMLPTVAAVINAIDDAVGVRITSLPATPEKILSAIKEKEVLG